MFDIPVVLFFMKRKEITLKVLGEIARAIPKKLYLISDAGRNPEEHEKVIECRQAVESAISWNCEIIKNYAETNMGVYDRIGKGAKWVFSMEEHAIFLEDDNCPSVTFFRYCEEMLKRYKDDTKILWVCGTNYLSEYESEVGASYIFTRHTLPCGWASWSHKFIKYYDGDLTLYSKISKKNIVNVYTSKNLFKQKLFFIERTKNSIKKLNKNVSWDHQMTASLIIHNMYGIVPCKNQIKNIGVDNDSTHGGVSFRNPMTKRFCGMEKYLLEFPLKHPEYVLPEQSYEKKVAKIITIPFLYMMGIKFNIFLKFVFKKIFKKNFDISLSSYIFRGKK